MSDSPGIQPGASRNADGIQTDLDPSAHVYYRYKCACSNGFTRIYRLGDKVTCAKCLTATHLTRVPVRSRNQYSG